MGTMHAAGGEIDIVCGDEGNVRLIGKADQVRFGGAFLGQPMALQFDVETVFKDVGQSL